MTAHHDTTTTTDRLAGLCDRDCSCFSCVGPISTGLLRSEQEAAPAEEAVTGSIICSVRGRLSMMPDAAEETPTDLGRRHPFALDQALGGRPHLSPLPFLIAPSLDAKAEHRLRIGLALAFATQATIELYGWAESIDGNGRQIGGLVFYAVRILDTAGRPL